MVNYNHFYLSIDVFRVSRKHSHCTLKAVLSKLYCTYRGEPYMNKYIFINDKYDLQETLLEPLTKASRPGAHVSMLPLLQGVLNLSVGSVGFFGNSLSIVVLVLVSHGRLDM
jgi:hypothetical protein